MKTITLGLLALFAVAVSSGAFADCPGPVVKSATTVATTDGSTPAPVPPSRDGG